MRPVIIAKRAQSLSAFSHAHAERSNEMSSCSGWEIDFTFHKSKEANAHLRDNPKEKAVETEITALLRFQLLF